VPCAKENKGTLPEQERKACQTHHESHRDGSNRQNSSLKLFVKDKWDKQEPWTLNLEWRDSARRAQKGNNGSEALYKAAGRWQLHQSITRSQSVKVSQDIKANNSVNQVNYK